MISHNSDNLLYCDLTGLSDPLRSHRCLWSIACEYIQAVNCVECKLQTMLLGTKVEQVLGDL